MKTSYYKFTIPHSRLATIQHLANSEKKDELAGANPPQKPTSDVYAVTAGVKFGNFDVLKCPLLASEDGFSSYYIQFFVRIFLAFTHAYALSKYKKRVSRQKIMENRSLNRFSTILPSYFRCLKVSPTSHLTHAAKSMRKFDPA